MDFGSTSNLKTIHQNQSPSTVALNSGNGEHLTFFLLVAKVLKSFQLISSFPTLGSKNRVSQSIRKEE